MKPILPIILCFIYSLSLAQQHSGAYPDAIPVPDKKIELRSTYNGKPMIVWREVEMKEPHLILNLAKRLVEDVKNNGLAAYNNPQDSLTQPQTATINQVLFSEMYPDTLNKILMLEQWDLDEQKGQMVVQLIALAPAYTSEGKYYPLFWNKYETVAPLLKEVKYSTDKQAKTMLDVFEQRLFTSFIIKK
jgi:hypothetical protein